MPPGAISTSKEKKIDMRLATIPEGGRCGRRSDDEDEGTRVVLAVASSAKAKRSKAPKSGGYDNAISRKSRQHSKRRRGLKIGKNGFMKPSTCRNLNSSVIFNCQGLLYASLLTYVVVFFVVTLALHREAGDDGSSSVKTNNNAEIDGKSRSVPAISSQRQRKLDERIQRNVPLYDGIYSSHQKVDTGEGTDGRISGTPPLPSSSSSSSSSNTNASLLLSKTYQAFQGENATETAAPCSVTILFVDPRLGDPSFGRGEPAWYALESVGAFAPYACVALLTSSCHVAKRNPFSVMTEEAAEQAARKNVYDKSLPLFREMIHSGLVRVSFLDVSKYGLVSCENYGNPTPALLNVNFWKDEFLDGVDSDTVITLQSDSVFCRPLDLAQLQGRFRKYAYIGGVWPPEATDSVPLPQQGMCRAIPGWWRSWLLPQRRWERQQSLVEVNSKRKRNTKKRYPRPSKLLDYDAVDSVCQNGNGPVGNGGFSVRSRRWMIEAIKACPHSKYSGIQSLSSLPLACKVLDEVNEDVYFSVVLRGLKAPLPSAAEAALFAVESLFLEDVLNHFGTAPAATNGTDTASSFLIEKEQERYGVTFHSQDDKRRVTVPSGVHKPFWYLPNEMLHSDEMNGSCPYLNYILKPEMSHYPKESKNMGRL